MLIQYNKEQQENPNKNNKPTTSKAASFLEEEDDDDEEGVSKSDISTAYGSVAELYLTDLW